MNAVKEKYKKWPAGLAEDLNNVYTLYQCRHSVDKMSTKQNEEALKDIENCLVLGTERG